MLGGGGVGVGVGDPSKASSVPSAPTHSSLPSTSSSSSSSSSSTTTSSSSLSSNQTPSARNVGVALVRGCVEPRRAIGIALAASQQQSQQQQQQQAALAFPTSPDQAQQAFDLLFRDDEWCRPAPAASAAAGPPPSAFSGRLKARSVLIDRLSAQKEAALCQFTKAAVEKVPIIVVFGDRGMDSHQFISLSQAVAFLSQTELRTPCHFGFVVGRDLLRFAAQSTEEYAEWEERILQALPSLNRARGPPLAEEDGRDVRIGGRKMRKQGKASPAPRTNSGIAPIFQRLRKSHSVDRLSSSNSHNPVTNGWRAGAAFMARFKPSTSSPPVESTEAPNPSPSPNVPDSDEIRARKPGQSSAPTVELDIKERLPPLNLRMSSLIPAEWVANPGSSDESATKNKEETLSDGGQRTHNAASNAAVGAKGSSPPRFTRFMRSDSIVYAFGSKAPDTSLDVVDMEKQPTSSPQMVWSKDFQRFLSFDVSGRSSERS